MFKLFMCVLFSCLSFSAVALEDFKINGFGSFRASITESSGGDDPNPYTKKEGELNFKDNTIMGLQFTKNFDEKWSAIAQVVAEGADDFEIESRWAYLRYFATPEHTMTIGRLANPIFHKSVFDKINYAHDFERLPTAVYSGFDFSVIDGISLDSVFDFNPWTLKTKVVLGSWEGEVLVRDSYEELGLDRMIGLNLELNYDWLTVFVGAFQVKMEAKKFDETVLVPSISNGLEYARINGVSEEDINEFISRTTWDDKKGIYSFGGFEIDKNDWLLSGEVVNYGITKSSDGMNTNYFVSVGRRIGKATIRVHYDEINQSKNLYVSKGSDSQILKSINKQLVNELSAIEQKGAGINFRYDIKKNLAFKLGYYYGDNKKEEIGYFYNLSGGLDYVF